MNIKLRFINLSQDVNNSRILIFQKNYATNMATHAQAWKVIRNCGYGCSHPFDYSTDLNIGISDDFGNYSPRLTAKNGQTFGVIPIPAGRYLKALPDSGNSKEVVVKNQLLQSSINVHAFNAGRIVASKTSVVPGQKAIFEFKPGIWIGAISEIEEGQAISSAIISDINTELSLVGVAQADIVMRGGGSGEKAEPFSFTLENIIENRSPGK